MLPLETKQLTKFKSLKQETPLETIEIVHV